ncbi:hypothetical protein [Paenibacillus soyae]|uniref:Uncharacterized protein n=1 Tax=Paenibacillus soyae TaxID=2969249 RepID=A0A9X2MT90_9BACL|nr:hypothetical protein [Paenibacillus soyae]MCR2805862.1 hypothetical protein [Paenibacillus soyae]
MKNIVASVIALIVIVFVVAISPWVTVSFAGDKVTAAFEKENRNVQDGCGLDCKDCGVQYTEKVLFGRNVQIEYACGLIPSDSPEYHQRKTLFVSFLGTVH